MDLTVDTLTLRHSGSCYKHIKSSDEGIRSIPCALRSRVVHAPGAKQRRRRRARLAASELVPRVQTARTRLRVARRA